MNVKDPEKLAARLERERGLARCSRYLILGLNRSNPGFGDDAALIDRETGRPLVFLSGVLRQGTRWSRDEAYCAACDEFRENGWTDGAGESETGEEPWEDWEEADSGEPEIEGAVVVPEGAASMEPGTQVTISYNCGDESGENPAVLKSDSYYIEIVQPSCGLLFHINKSMDGVILDEDFFPWPLVCWNTGTLPVKVEGHSISPGAYWIISPRELRRRERRRRFKDIMSLPVWDGARGIEEVEETLRGRSCPKKDVHVLAVFLWCSPLFRPEDYDPADHAAWMEEVHREGRPRRDS